MSTSIAERTDPLNPRVATLERRALIATGVAALALALASVAVAASAVAFVRLARLENPGGARMVEASEIVLRNEQGDLRGRWTVQGLSLVDETGRLRAGLSIGSDGTPLLAFFGNDGRTRAVLGLGAEDAPAMTLHDAQSGVRARVAVNRDAAPTFTLSSANGDVLTQLPAPLVTAPRKGR